MKISEYITKVLSETMSCDTDKVEFDIGVGISEPSGTVWVQSSSTNRLKFSVKTKSKKEEIL